MRCTLLPFIVDFQRMAKIPNRAQMAFLFDGFTIFPYWKEDFRRYIANAERRKLLRNEVTWVGKLRSLQFFD